MLINNIELRINEFKDEIRAAAAKVIDSGWLILGPSVVEFEDKFSKYIGAEHCISCANGTDAIEIALRAFGMGRGDAIATVANAGMYSTTAILAIGAEPIFMEVDLHTRNVTLHEVEKAIMQGAKAIVVTHLYGLAVPDIEDIALLCKRCNIPLLEDCAQAHGAIVGHRRLGVFGDAASFSFYPTKNLGALGDGGAVVTNNSLIADEVKKLRQYGWSSKYKVEIRGGRNSRLDEIQAAFLLVFLPSLDITNQKRCSIATQYSKSISHPLVSAPPIYGKEFVSHLYVVNTPEREGLKRHLLDFGISSDIHYPIPDYRQPVFGNKYDSISLTNTEKLSREILTLPCYPEMTNEDVSRVIDAVNSWNEKT